MIFRNCPGGTPDLSPAIHRWEEGASHPRPGGMLECSSKQELQPSRWRLLKKSEIKAFAYKIMGMEFFDRSILSIEIVKTDFSAISERAL
jgi:hypothetical protein